MRQLPRENLLLTLLVGAAAWAIPGAGHLIIGENRRAAVIFVCIAALFFLGLWVGSVGVIDPIEQGLWYISQMVVSPAVAILGYINSPVGTSKVPPYQVNGHPMDIGQIYTFTAGMLNLLCIVHAMYVTYSGKLQPPQSGKS